MDTQRKNDLKVKLRTHGIFLKDIAEKCECSLSLVSCVLSGKRADYFNILPTAGNLLHEKVKQRRKLERILEAA